MEDVNSFNYSLNSYLITILNAMDVTSDRELFDLPNPCVHNVFHD